MPLQDNVGTLKVYNDLKQNIHLESAYRALEQI